MAKTTQTTRKKPIRQVKRPAGSAPAPAPAPVSELVNIADQSPRDAPEYVHINSELLDPATMSDAELVRRTLRLIMLDANAPAAAKAQAARTLAEMAQMLGRDRVPPPDPSKPVGELTRAELEAELAALAAQ